MYLSRFHLRSNFSLHSLQRYHFLPGLSRFGGNVVTFVFATFEVFSGCFRYSSFISVEVPRRSKTTNGLKMLSKIQNRFKLDFSQSNMARLLTRKEQLANYNSGCLMVPQSVQPLPQQSGTLRLQSWWLTRLVLPWFPWIHFLKFFSFSKVKVLLLFPDQLIDACIWIPHPFVSHFQVAW